MLRAFAVFSKWLPVERRRRSGAGLGAARSGDFDSVDFGMGTSSAAGAVRCRTGCVGRSYPKVVGTSSTSSSSIGGEGIGGEGDGTISCASGREAGRRGSC